MGDRNVTAASGATSAHAGYDHDWFTWRPLPARPGAPWPGGARVAVSVVIDLGAAEWEHEPVIVPPVGGRGIAVAPDFPRLSHREFGHRVGVFRLLDGLTALDIAPAVVVDVLTVEHYGGLLDHLWPVAGEMVAGGLSASRPVTSAMSAEEEGHYIAMSMDRLTRVLGTRPAGWRGPEHTESHRTPGLLAAAGLDYVMDWCNDERPYPMEGAGGDLWAFPLSWELSDVAAMFLRDVGADDYGLSLTDAFDVLSEDDSSWRVLAVHLHPWLSGQPFRVGAVERALAHMRRSEHAWFATPHEIVEWCRRGP